MATTTNRVGLSYRQAITAKCLPPTNHKGKRIKVSASQGVETVTVSWNYELDTAENYAEAVQIYLDHMGWEGRYAIGSTSAGYVAVWVGNE